MGQRLSENTFYVVSEDASSYLKVKRAQRGSRQKAGQIVFVTPDELAELVFDSGTTFAVDTRVIDSNSIDPLFQREGCYLVPFEPSDLSQLNDYFLSARR